MEKTAFEKNAAQLSDKARDAATDLLEKLAKAEDQGEAMILATSAAAYSNLAVLHKLDQIKEALSEK